MIYEQLAALVHSNLRMRFSPKYAAVDAEMSSTCDGWFLSRTIQSIWLVSSPIVVGGESLVNPIDSVASAPTRFGPETTQSKIVMSVEIGDWSRFYL